MLPSLLGRLGAVALVFGGVIFFLTLGEGYPTITRAAVLVIGIGIVCIVIGYGLAALGAVIKNRQRASE